MKPILPALAFGLGLATTAITPAAAYPIDCAILLCLAGGWPSSAECTLARAEFIRRITPVPVEPPLQIWRCPLGPSLPAQRKTNRQAKQEERDNTVLFFEDAEALGALPEETIGSGADIDISSAAFDFVRSIDVFRVQVTQRESADGDCNGTALVRHGSYGANGQFRWRTSSILALPAAFLGLEGYGDHCPSVRVRAVFVDWADYQGTYGFEQIGY